MDSVGGAVSGAAALTGIISNDLKTPENTSTGNTGWSKQSLADWSGSTNTDTTKNNVLGSSVGAMAAGAAVGSIVPGIGTAIGAGVGMLAGLTSSLVGNAKRRRLDRIRTRQASGKVATQNAAINQDSLNNFLTNTYAYGGHFSSGISKIGSGGGHEENPLGGIPVSIGENGEPNLVEEGEARWNNYIFSNRLAVPDNKEEMKLIGIPKSYEGLPFSKAAIKMSREAEERENDPVSKRGMDNMLARLSMAQEIERATMQEMSGGTPGQGNVFWPGGPEETREEDETKWTKQDKAGLEIEARPRIPYTPFSRRGVINPVNLAVNPLTGNAGLGLSLWDNAWERPSFLDRDTSMKSFADSQYDGAKWWDKPWDASRVSSLATRSAAGRNPGGGTREGWLSKVYDDGKGLRYVPVVTNAALGLEALLSKPDKMELERMTAPAVTERMTYNPYDTDYMAGMMRQQANAANRRLVDSAGGNAGIAAAMMLANNRNSQEILSKAMMDAVQNNEIRRNQALQFNAQQSQFNAQMEAAARQANLQQSNSEKDYNSKAKAARANAIRQALATIGTQLGGIGNESYWGEIARNTQGYDRYGRYVKPGDREEGRK
jgi:hypothetical protein